MPTMAGMPTRNRSTFLLFAVGTAFALGLLFGVLGGAMWITHDDDLGGWMTGTAHVGSDQFSAEVDRWTYGVQGSVPMWIDAHGTHHDGGWPECLKVSSGSDTPVTFQAREVAVEGNSWRQIVAVDCRAS